MSFRQVRAILKASGNGAGRPADFPPRAEIAGMYQGRVYFMSRSHRTHGLLGIINGAVMLRCRSEARFSLSLRQSQGRARQGGAQAH